MKLKHMLLSLVLLTGCSKQPVAPVVPVVPDITPAADIVTASVTPATTTGTVPVTVNFTGTATSSLGTITWYQWTFGDGSFCVKSPTCQLTISHQYVTAGKYSPSLSVKDSKGNTWLASASVITSAISCKNGFNSTTDYVLPVWETALTFTNPTDVMYSGTVTKPVITTTSQVWLPESTSTSYCLFLEAGGGTPPYTFTGQNIPSGLMLSNNLLSGSLKPGTYTNIILSVTDSKGLFISLIPRSLRVCDPTKSCNGFN